MSSARGVPRHGHIGSHALVMACGADADGTSQGGRGAVCGAQCVRGFVHRTQGCIRRLAKFWSEVLDSRSEFCKSWSAIQKIPLRKFRPGCVAARGGAVFARFVTNAPQSYPQNLWISARPDAVCGPSPVTRPRGSGGAPLERPNGHGGHALSLPRLDDTCSGTIHAAGGSYV